MLSGPPSGWMKDVIVLEAGACFLEGNVALYDDIFNRCCEIVFRGDGDGESVLRKGGAAESRVLKSGKRIRRTGMDLGEAILTCENEMYRE